MITRRRFLIGAGGATAAGVGGLAISRAVGATKAAPKPATTLVLVAMYGGNDGLNTLIPYQDPAYLGGRPTLGYQPHDVLALDHGLALNPGLTGFKSLWDASKLAIVRGVGYPNPNYSHFRSMDIWQSAAPDSVEQSGWLGRWLDQLGGTDPLVAAAIGPTVPRLLQGTTTAAAAIPSATLAFPGGPAAEKAFAALSTGGSGLGGRIAQSGADLLTVLHRVRAVVGAVPPPSKSTNPLGRQLDLVGQLIKGGLQTRVYVVTATGFDTHIAEKANHQRLLGQVDQAVTAFVHSMASDPRGAGVVVMTFSEFGRRVAQNASGGTDHGSASPLFVTGPGVKGGFYGEQPSLTDLDNGNLKFTTDFRSVYATVADKVLGIDPRTVLLGKSFPTLGFV